MMYSKYVLLISILLCLSGCSKISHLIQWANRQVTQDNQTAIADTVMMEEPETQSSRDSDTDSLVHDPSYDRSSLRNSISRWNSCENGTLTCKYGAIAYYRKNGYTHTISAPDHLISKMQEVHDARGTFTDINITDGGYYILVWNETEWYGYMPQPLLDKLRSLPDGTKFRSVSFNDSGEYIIVTSDYIYSSSSAYLDFFATMRVSLGELYSANIWQNGAVFCFQKGPTFYGKVPSNVVQAMNTCQMIPRFVKFNHHGDFLICSSTGYCSYCIADADKSSGVQMANNYPKGTSQNNNNSAKAASYNPAIISTISSPQSDHQEGLRRSIANMENSLQLTRQRLDDQISRGASPMTISSTRSLIQTQEESLSNMRSLLR